MPKPSIFHGVPSAHLITTVPPEYRARVQGVVAPDRVYTVLLFQHERRSVVMSPVVRKALDRVPTGEALVAIGANFTAEAIELLDERGALVIRLGDFYWTDESYNSVRS